MNQSQLSDSVLVLRCQLGDNTAWDELVHRWQPRLWGFLSRMIADRAVAEDVLQTVWLKVVRSLSRLDDPEHWAAWVFRIARASVADHLRKQYRAPPREPLSEIAVGEQDDSGMEAREFVGFGLSRLHPTDRETVLLHYIEQMPVAEVAAICEVPIGTVKSRLYRAREQLQEILTERGNGHESN